MSLPKEIHDQIDALPPELAGELVSFLDYLKHKGRRGVPELDEETRAWLGADLSRMGEIEPYDWGDEDPAAGKPVIWDAERGAFVIVGGRDAAS